MPGMDIHEAARRIGALAWTEQQLFEVVGAWVVSTPEPEAKLLLARQSRHHGDHVLALTAVLPDTRDHDPPALVAPGADDPSAGLDGASTGARLDALLAVVAQQCVALERFLADASPIRDGPALRIARLVLDEDGAEAVATRRLRGGIDGGDPRHAR